MIYNDERDHQCPQCLEYSIIVSKTISYYRIEYIDYECPACGFEYGVPIDSYYPYYRTKLISLISTMELPTHILTEKPER